MNYLDTDIFLLFIAINISFCMIFFISFLIKKQEPEETQRKETQQKETEKEKTDSINILNEKVYIFLKDYNKNSANVEVVLDRPKSFLIKAFPSIEYYPVLDVIILTIEFNEKYEKLLKTYSNYFCADIYYLRNIYEDFYIRRIEKTKYNEIIFEFAHERRTMKKLCKV